MKFTTTIAALAFAAGAIASPVSVEAAEAAAIEERAATGQSIFTPTPIFGCLLPYQATQIVNAFSWLLANPKSPSFAATANALFSNSFTDTSDSINQITGAPEGSVTFNSKQAFITGSGSQPPLVVKTLDSFNGCSAISWRWISVSGAGDDAEPVKGIDNFYITPQGQINSVYAEFNSGAFLANLGNPECKASS